ncbi:hypothetical protein ACH427_04280 [Streptomyces sp. NPDC020379]|uniref:hypothetical protein n=1 Tax=Streptomyces sp. NPDC020379 TaxID=3365071 RepID=UPI0037976780
MADLSLLPSIAGPQVQAGRRYRLTAPEGIGVGLGKLNPGITVEVYDVTPPGQRPNPYQDQPYVSFVYLDDRIQPGELVERHIGYGQVLFAQSFQLLDDSTVPVGEPSDRGGLTATTAPSLEDAA